MLPLRARGGGACEGPAKSAFDTLACVSLEEADFGLEEKMERGDMLCKAELADYGKGKGLVRNVDE